MKALDHRMTWGRPADNYYSLVQQQTEKDAHKHRLLEARSVVETKAPTTVPHLRVNLKKQQQLEDRYNDIELENRILLQKMSKIMKSPASMPLPVTRGSAVTTAGKRLGPTSLNRDQRKKDLDKINNENQKILKRIQKGKGVYDRSHWAKDRAMQEQYLALHKKRNPLKTRGRGKLSGLAGSRSLDSFKSPLEIAMELGDEDSSPASFLPPIGRKGLAKPAPLEEAESKPGPSAIFHEALPIDGVTSVVTVFTVGRHMVFKAYDPKTSTELEARLGVNDVKLLLSEEPELLGNAERRRDLCATLARQLHYFELDGHRTLSFGAPGRGKLVRPEPSDAMLDYSDDET